MMNNEDLLVQFLRDRHLAGRRKPKMYPESERECAQCHSAPARPNSLYCSDACKKAFYKEMAEA
jgi:hypothetical protein